MQQHGITRRDFLRYSAAALGSLWLASVLPAPTARSQDTGYGTPRLTPQFDALPNPTLLGAPADVALGADGVPWVIGTDGAPSAYDPLQQAWLPFGGRIDAAAYIPFLDSDGSMSYAFCYFRGGEVYKSGTPGPVPIASLWPNLPPSFQQGVDGAACINANEPDFYLFRQGQAALVNIWGVVYIAPLTSFDGAGWPGGAWQGGLFDYVISGQDSAFPGHTIFVRSGEYIVADLVHVLITTGPQPLSAGFGGAAAALLAQGDIQAVVCPGSVLATDAPLQVFSGPVVYTLANSTATTPPQAQYLGAAIEGWPAAWHPILQSAPAGSVGNANAPGNLWSLDHGGTPLVNAGSGWAPRPLPGNTPATGLDVGADGSVYAIAPQSGGSALYSLNASGSSWTTTATTAMALQGLAVGSGSYVWVRDGQGSVYRYEGSGSFAQANLGVTASDINADPDGTLWHCSAGQGSVYRYLAGGGQTSESISVGQGVTSVVKAASSRFGTGLFLAQQNGQPALVQYTSPYVFKTASSYFTGAFPTIAVGASSIFLSLPDTVNRFRVVALDAETGAERWSNTYFDPSDGALSPLYDPHHHLVYAFSTMGEIWAYDAHSGQQVWSVGLQPVLPVTPVLAGGLLLYSGTDSPTEYPNSRKVYLAAIDTLAAVQAAANQQQVQPRWQFTIDATGQQPEPTPPVAANGSVYCGVWSQTGTPILDILRVDAATGAGAQLYGDMDQFGSVYNPVSEIVPLMAPVKMPTGQTVPALVLAGPDGLYAFQLDGSGEFAKYTNGLSADNMIVTNLVYYDGVIYCGDVRENVHAVDGSFAPVPGSPYRFTSNNSVFALAAAPDANGAAILIARDGSAQLALYFTGGGISGTLATNQTQIGTMSAVTPEGMIYVGGSSDGVNSGNLAQIFGIRTNDLRDLRDFVVESQLLQDYDPGAVAVARYQTHVTVVDDNKVPRPLVDVKLWADETLDVIVAGQPYTIGPDAPLATQVDASGTLTILSDATDLFATPLRLWAAFMDPNERIVIYPDQEFHARLPNMTADPNNDDPGTINLATGTNYGGAKVFTDQTQAQAVATAVKTASSRLGLGAGTASMLAGAAVTAAEQPFIAYADLPGVRYFAANTPATRQPVPQGTLGLSLNQNGTNEFVVMGFAAAAAAIDALEGVPDPALLGLSLGSWFSHIWHDIKRGVAKVTKVVVSVANSIYIGLTYVVNGVTHVVRQVVNDIEDVASLIGAVFVELGKLIADVIELLSLLLHFEEIIATYKLLQPALLGQVQALATVIPNQLQGAVAAFFGAGDKDILDAFCTVKKQIDPSYVCSSTAQAAAGSPAVSTFDGVGATPHTIFTVTPKGGGAASSLAVHATWGLHKVKDHYKAATVGAGQAPGDDPLVDFFTTFAGSLNSNPDMKKAFDNVQSDFADTFKVNSATEFLQLAIIDLLDIMQLLLVDGLGIAQALLSGLLKLGQDLVDYLVGADGLLMRSLDIPIISDLFKLLTGDDLTFFNLIVLVASIPITIVYRVIEGAWPADQAAAAATNAPVLARLFGILEVASYVGNAIFAAVADMFIVEGESPPVVAIILVGLGIGSAIPSSYSITDSAEGVNLSAQIAQIAVGGLGDLGGAAQFSEAAPVLLTICALTAISTAIAEKVKNDISWTGFSADILGEIPPFVRPLQYLAKQFPFATTVTLASIDMGVNFATALADFIGLVQVWDALPDLPTALPPDEEPGMALPGRAYLPVIGAP